MCSHAVPSALAADILRPKGYPQTENTGADLNGNVVGLTQSDLTPLAIRARTVRTDSVCDTDMSVKMVHMQAHDDAFPISQAGGRPRYSATHVSLHRQSVSAAAWPEWACWLNAHI